MPATIVRRVSGEVLRVRAASIAVMSLPRSSHLSCEPPGATPEASDVRIMPVTSVDVELDLDHVLLGAVERPDLASGRPA